MSHVPAPPSGDLAVHMGYVLKNVEAMAATLSDMRNNMATKADVQGIADKADKRAETLEARVTTLEHERTAMRSSFRTAVALVGLLSASTGAGGAWLYLSPTALPPAAVAKVAP